MPNGRDKTDKNNRNTPNKKRGYSVTVSIIAMPERDEKLAELIACLDNQTTQDFDIRITRPPSDQHPDGNVRRLKSLFNKYAKNIASERISITQAPVFHQHQRLANQLTRLKHACNDQQQGSPFIAFLDDDDRIPADYIATGLSAMKAFNADVVTGDLLAFVEGHEERGFTSVLSPRQKFGDHITKEDLVHSNRVGLGHTFMRTAALGRIPDELTSDVQVIDWAIFARMAHQGRSIRYAGPKLYIEYRQHAGPNENISGLFRTDPKTMLWSIQAKAKHYQSMSNSRYVNEKDRQRYTSLAEHFGQLLDRAQKDPRFLERYTKDMKQDAANRGIDKAPFWWETARPSHELAHTVKHLRNRKPRPPKPG